MTRRIKTAFTIGLFAVLAGVHSAGAQTHKGDIDIIPVHLEQRGDSLYVDMEIRLSAVQVKSRMSVDLTPKLVSAVWSTDLPVVSVKGGAITRLMSGDFSSKERRCRLPNGRAKISF